MPPRPGSKGGASKEAQPQDAPPQCEDRHTEIHQPSAQRPSPAPPKGLTGGSHKFDALPPPQVQAQFPIVAGGRGWSHTPARQDQASGLPVLEGGIRLPGTGFLVQNHRLHPNLTAPNPTPYSLIYYLRNPDEGFSEDKRP